MYTKFHRTFLLVTLVVFMVICAAGTQTRSDVDISKNRRAIDKSNELIVDLQKQAIDLEKRMEKIENHFNDGNNTGIKGNVSDVK